MKPNQRIIFLSLTFVNPRTIFPTAYADPELDILNSPGSENLVIPRAIGMQFVGCLAIFVSQILMLDCPMKGMRPYKSAPVVVNLTIACKYLDLTNTIFTAA